MGEVFQPLDTRLQELPPIPDEADITKARKIGDEKIKGLSVEEIKQLRIECKWNLFFLAYGPLGYTKLSPRLHGNICGWLESMRYEKYTLMLIPRSHFKSTIQTIAESVQTALPDDSGNALYPYNLGPNVRQLIAHDVHTMAQKFLRSITQHFTVNPLIIALFPELVPNWKKQKVNITELELPRESVWNESTFDTMGVGARGQGNHYNIIRLDDIYGEAARDSKTEREGHIQWIDNIQSFLLTPKTDLIRIAGTRWAFDDVYAHIMKVYGNKLKTYIKSVYEKDEKGNQVPIFPEQFDMESLEILKKNKKVWNAQYINDPKEGAAAFQAEWKRFYKLKGRTLEIYEQRTPFSDPVIEEVSYEELDKVILVDPALDGLSGIVVTGMDRRKRVFILECFKDNLKPEELRDKIFSLVMKYNPRVVCIEEVLFSALFEVWFRTEMLVKGVKFRIDGLRTRQQEKATRVAALANWFSSNSIFFKDDPSDKMMQALIEEYDQFGATDDYHMLDALAYGTRNNKEGSPVWKPGGGFRRTGNVGEGNKNNRDVLTGYSKIRG